MFDIGKIQTVTNNYNDGVLELKVFYDQVVTISVPLKLDDYASESVTIPDKQYQWRLLTSDA